MKQFKRFLAIIMTMVLTVSFIPVTSSAASTKSQLQSNIAKWEKELEKILADDNIVRIEEAQVWTNEPTLVVFVPDESHPVNMKYWHGYYIKGMPYEEIQFYRTGSTWSGYVKLLNEPAKYARTALGDVTCSICQRADEVYELKEKIWDAEVKLEFLKGKLTSNSKSMNILYNDGSYYFADLNSFDNWSKPCNMDGYLASSDNHFDISFDVTGADMFTHNMYNYPDELSKYITWESSNPKIAAINSVDYIHKTVDFVVKKSGKCTITGKIYGSSSPVKINVNVALRTKGISITPRSANLKKGETVKLTYTMKPKNSVKEKVKWISSDPSVAYVSAVGTVKAIGPGTAYIFAYTESGFTSLSCKVKVNGTAQTTTKIDSDIKAISAIKTSQYVTKDSKSKYLYECDNDWYIPTISFWVDGVETEVQGYNVVRCSPISDTIKYRYSDLSNKENSSRKYVSESFFVFEDGKIMCQNKNGSYEFITDYFTDDENQTGYEKFIDWLDKNKYELLVYEDTEEA